MNKSLSCIAAALAFAALPVIASGSDEPIQVNTQGLQAHVAEQVQKHAADSERALMQYLWFNRRMHHLWLDDVTKPKKMEDVAANETREKRVAVLMHPHGFR